jgi:tRNA nucleotidyltransferase (CCA-adding enzyme)
MDYIISHNNLDFDGLSSMAAAKCLYQDALMVLPANQERSVRNFLTLYRHFAQALKEKYVRQETITRIIVLDTQDPDKTGIFKDFFYNASVKKIIFDHHPLFFTPPEMKKYNIELKHSETGANVTQLIERIQRKKIKVSPFLATLLGLGIYDDTGSLTYTSTTQRDLKAAAWLMGRKMSLSFIQDFIRPQLGYEQMKILNRLIDSLEVHKIKGISISFAFDELDSYMGDLAMLAHKIRDLENISVLFLVVKMGSSVHVVARSRAEILNLSRVFATLGGGGHPTAASAVLKTASIKKAFKDICRALEKEAGNPRCAEDIMTSPVKSINSLCTVSAAKQLMIKYNISGLPVVDDDRLAGIISRGDIDKAVHHNLSHAPVKAFMTTHVIVVSPKTPVAEVKKLLLTNHIARVPVIDGHNRMTGLISGTDLLRLIHDDLVSLPLSDTDDNVNYHLKESGTVSTSALKVLPVEKLNFFRTAGKIAEAINMKLFIAGGLVRDIILFYKGIIRDPGVFENSDTDFVVQGDGIEFARQLSEKFKGKIKIHHEFQTAAVIIPGHNYIDIATARFEYYSRPGALPDIEAGSIRNDLQRRDFSINAMAISLNPDTFGRLLDYFEGQNDIDSRNIRILHNLSFIEDPTRVFRAVRFAARYEFRIEPRTLSLIKGAIENYDTGSISHGRLKAELMLVLRETSAGAACRLLDKYNIFSRFWPEINFSLKILSALNRSSFLIEKWAQSKALKKDDLKPENVKLNILFSNVNDKNFLVLAQKLILSKKYVDRFLNYKKVLKEIASMDFKQISKESFYYDLFNRLSLDQIVALCSLENDFLQKKAYKYLTEYSKIVLAVNGTDIIKCGISPGPGVKSILKSLMGWVIDKEIKNNYRDLINKASSLK